MSYVESNLMNAESVIYTAKMHWIIYIKSIGILLVSILMLFSAETRALSVIGLVVAAGFWLVAWIQVISTELAVTNKRIIAKIGFIRRNTIELEHAKVESLSVNQTIPGRILNYGTLIVNGVGGNRLPVCKISKPLEFRQQTNRR